MTLFERLLGVVAVQVTGLVMAVVEAPPGETKPPSMPPPTPPVTSEIMATPRLLVESRTVTPGGRLTAAIEWTIKPGWHMYWDGQNDTGLPPSVEWVLPERVTAGRLQWPAPKRYISPGDLLDYVHEGRFVLLCELTFPPDAKVGDRLTLAANLTWQVCEEMCMIEEARREVVVTVAAESSYSGDTHPSESVPDLDKQTVHRAQTLLPQPLTPKAEITVERSGTTLSIRVAGATKLAFFPRAGDPEVGGAWLEDGLTSGERAGGSIRLQFDLTPRGREFPPAARGVLEVTRGVGKDPSQTTAERSTTEYWLIDEPLGKGP